MSGQANESGQGVSHASSSILPESIQKAVPKSVEEAVPNAIHDTGISISFSMLHESNADNSPSGAANKGKDSHATDPEASKVPHAIQQGAPEKLERNLPESIHPTGDK